MKVKNENWSIEKLQKLEEKINPQPQYQRGPVWTRAAKQLLIDSILCHFDIPKIYLHTRTSIGSFEYDVTDGQQRMRAIWEYLKDEFPLGDSSYQANAPWCGMKFSELHKSNSDQLLGFELVMAIISNATNDEVRELFSRLQRGVRLTPAELRNSIPSQLGDAIRSIADTHELFTHKSCPFDDTRFQHRDLCALTFAILIHKGKRDLKAPILKAMFLDHAGGLPDGVTEQAMKVLDTLKAIQVRSNWAVKTKWGYVDLCFYISENLDKKLEPAHIAARYLSLEQRRRKFSSNPEELLGAASPSPANRRLYNYIVAFKTSGGLSANIRRRHEVLVTEFRAPAAKKRK